MKIKATHSIRNGRSRLPLKVLLLPLNYILLPFAGLPFQYRDTGLRLFQSGFHMKTFKKYTVITRQHIFIRDEDGQGSEHTSACKRIKAVVRKCIREIILKIKSDSSTN